MQRVVNLILKAKTFRTQIEHIIFDNKPETIVLVSTVIIVDSSNLTGEGIFFIFRYDFDFNFAVQGCCYAS